MRVKVPATTANLGPGFDALGMALEMYNEVEMAESSYGLNIEVIGEGEDVISRKENNIVVQAARKVFESVGFKPKGLSIRLINNIPTARGLGSSAAAIVGGVVAANHLSGNKLSEQELLDIAAAIEGHPDNVAPALLGGMVLSVSSDSGLLCRKITPPAELTAVVAIPDFPLSTRAAREVLPRQVPLTDAVYNISRAAAVVYAFTSGDMNLLRVAMDDRLHQPYRQQLVPGMADVFQAVKESGALAVALSGAGPTLIAFINGASGRQAGQVMFNTFLKHGVSCVIKEVKPAINGAQLVSRG